MEVKQFDKSFSENEMGLIDSLIEVSVKKDRLISKKEFVFSLKISF